MLAVEVEFLLYIEPARAISQCSRSARYSRVFVYSEYTSICVYR
jgi:hypothetical protein